jgi:hypothetical protein
MHVQWKTSCQLNWLPSNVRLVNNSEVHVEKAHEFTIMS